MQKRFLLAILVSFTIKANAQMDVGIGAAFGFPMLFNEAVKGYNHSLGAPAGRLQFTYHTPNGTFLPSLSMEVAPYVLPITRLGNTDRVLNMNFTVMNAMLHGRIKKTLNNGKELYYGLGVGAAYLSGRSVGLSGNQNSYVTVIEDSTDYIKTIVPQAMLSAEYVMRVSGDAPIFLGVGAQLQYSYFFERQTTWRISVVDDQFNLYNLRPKLQGHMINPGVYVVLYYRFGNKNAY